MVRALKLIQAGQPVARGTLQTMFRYTPYDELRRLGLPPAAEQEARAASPSRTGMLVVTEVQPGAAADGQLAVGDVLVAIDGKAMSDFEAVDALLDDSVGKAGRARGRARRRHAQGHAARCRTCTRSRRTTTSRSATACCTRCPGRWRGT